MDTLLRRLMVTTDQWSLLVIRLTLAVVILPHGLQKTFGWFGGHGFNGTMSFFTETMGVPAVVAFLVIMAESLGSVAIAAGFLTRFCAASLTLVMIGAITMAHLDYGFFMNWSGAQAGEGYEYHLLVIGMAIALMIGGAGRWSVDRKLSR